MMVTLHLGEVGNSWGSKRNVLHGGGHMVRLLLMENSTWIDVVSYL